MHRENAANKWLFALLEESKALPAYRVFFSNFLLLLIIAYFDYITGYELAFSLFYLVPVSLSAWLLGRGSYWFFSILSGVAWVVLDITGGHTYTTLVSAVWNGVVRVEFFIIVSSLLFSVRGSLDKEKQLARYDYLTGIPNSRSFFETGNKELYRSKRYKRALSLAYMDIDNFKHVNDKEGHKRGDFLLAKTGKTLSHNIRASDTVARLGGDEFAMIFPETDSVKAKITIRKIKAELDKMKKANGFHVTFSIGVVTCYSKDCTFEELIKLADNQMYSVKNNGKNDISYKSLR